MKILQQNKLENQPKARNVRDAFAIGSKRSKLTLELAARLETLVAVVGTEKAVYNAAKLAKCGSVANVWTGIDLHNSDGEAFDGVGALWACSLPYCQNCAAVKATRHRRRIRQTLGHLKPRVGLKWRFITLTSPSVRASPLEAIEVYQTAWALLRKRKFWADRVKAGYRGIEFTVNDSTGLVHCHLHCLALSKHLDYDALRSEWTDCIALVWKRRGVSLHFKTIDQKAIVKVIEPRGRELGQKAMDAAILETAKYCADGAAWASLSDAHLIEVANLERFPRLFESFGETRNNSLDTILDNPDLNDGEKSQTLKTTKPKRINDLKTLNLRVNVSRTYQKAHLIRRFPVAKFQTLDGRDFLPSEPKFTGTLTLVKKPKEHKPMKLPAILLDETSDISRLTDELGHIPSQLKDAARRGDETALAALSDRRSQLPELIQKARMSDFGKRLSVARSRVAAFDIELQNAVRRAGTLATKVETDVPVLQSEIEQLRSASAEAHHERDNLQFAAKQARDELERIQNERESLLLAQFGTN
jgi:hypothetical protein